MHYQIREFTCLSAGNLLWGEAFVPEAPGRLPVLICSHGFNVTHRHFHPLAERFVQEGYVCVCFDFAGGSVNGRSQGSSLEMSVFTERQNLMDVLETVRGWDFVDPERVFLLGESLGGSVTAITAPFVAEKIRGVVLAFPAFCLPADGYEQFPTVEDLPDSFEMLGMTIGKVYLQDFYEGYDFYEEIVGYQGPVLLVHGTEDPLVNPSYSVKAARVYANCELHWIDGAGHGFYAPEYKALYYSYVAAFLTRCQSSARP